MQEGIDSTPDPSDDKARAEPAFMEVLQRALPVLPPREPPPALALPDQALFVETATEHPGGGRALVGAYRHVGVGFEHPAGLFEGPAGLPGEFKLPPRSGPTVPLDHFLERRLFWLGYKLPRVGIVTWDATRTFTSIAPSFEQTKLGLRLYLFTYSPKQAPGRVLVDTYRPPIDLSSRGDHVFASFGRRRSPDPEDLVPPPERWSEETGGRSADELRAGGWSQYRGRFPQLRHIVEALFGNRIDDLYAACALFEVTRPPRRGPARPENLQARIDSMVELYEAVLRELGEWPGVPFLAPDSLTSSASLVKATLRAGGVRPPLLRDRDESLRVPEECLEAGMAAASIGARAEVRVLRAPVPGIDLDGHNHYPNAAWLADVQGFLTRHVTAHHVADDTPLRELRATVEAAIEDDRLLEDPAVWRSLSLLAKVRPHEDFLTVRIGDEDREATVTTTIEEGSVEFWTSGFDLACSAIVTGRVPEIVEAWWFELGEELPGLHPVDLPEGWCWDPTGRLSGAKVRQNLFLLLAEMRMRAKTDPNFSPARRIRLGGALKVSDNAGAFGIFMESYPASNKALRSLKVPKDRASERSGLYSFPPAAAFVQGAGRLLLGLFLRDIDALGAVHVAADTDGAFVPATEEGGLVPCPGGPELDTQGRPCIRVLSFDELQGVRDRFASLARASGLPIPPERIDGRQIVQGEGAPSLFKLEGTAVTEGGSIADTFSYVTGLESFLIAPSSDAGKYKASEAIIGEMCNPSGLDGRSFARRCREFQLALDTPDAELPEWGWLDLPEVYPMVLRRGADLERARALIPDLLPGEGVMYASKLFKKGSVMARLAADPAAWLDMTWFDSEGRQVRIGVPTEEDGGSPAIDSESVALVRSWRVFLARLRRRGVPFTLGADGQVCHDETRGLLAPQPLRLIGVTPVGRTDWAHGRRGRILSHDPRRLALALEILGRMSEGDLRRFGLSPRTVRALRQGRSPYGKTQELVERVAGAFIAKQTGQKPGAMSSATVAAFASQPMTCACPEGDQFILRDQRQRYSSPSHKKRAQRARRQVRPTRSK